MDFHTTQELIVHVAFGTYLYILGKNTNDKCWYYKKINIAEHIKFHCIRWNIERDQTNRKCEENITRDNILELMLQVKETWNNINKLIMTIILKKQNDRRT